MSRSCWRALCLDPAGGHFDFSSSPDDKTKSVGKDWMLAKGVSASVVYL
jgi:hypothetical protein